MTIRTFIELARATLICLPALAFAHGGGLNAEGCHNNRKTGDYHCHGGQGARPGQSKDSASGASTSKTVPPGNGGSPTCFTGPRGGTYTITKSGRKNYGGC